MSGSVSAILNKAEHLLPGVPFDTILPWRRRVVAEGGVTTAAAARTKLLIGPENAAGQGAGWARAAETLGDVAAACLVIGASDAPWRFDADHRVSSSIAAHGPWQRAQARALQSFTHVLIESGKPLYRGEPSMAKHVSGLRRHGIEVSLVWHGSDIRSPERHEQVESDSPFSTLDKGMRRRLADRVRLNASFSKDFSGTQYVSTPDLLAEVPGSLWLPVVVNKDEWAAAARIPTLEREVPIVAHAPSNASMKGSAGVGEALLRLREEGLIDYREATGLSHAEMREFYATADIVLDQFAIGSYGVASVEAMAAGCVVIGHVRDDVRGVVRERTGMELPIVESRRSELAGVVRQVLADRTAHQHIAMHGTQFSESVHSASAAARVLNGFLAA